MPESQALSLLALDIGAGTQDLVLFEPDRKIENAVKMVLPAPTQVLAKRVRRVTKGGKPLHLSGYLMGGGAIGKAIAAHLAAGLPVSAEPAAAATLNDDPEKVRAMGIRLGEAPPYDAVTIHTGDLMLKELEAALVGFGLPMPQRLAVAVCDHGHSPGFSNRKFRFQYWQRFLENGGRLADLITDSPPPEMTRMAAVCAAASGSLVMDTAAASLWGALQDPAVAARRGEGICVVNLGNMHAVAFLLKGEKVLGVFEHHTGVLDQKTLADNIARFIAGGIDDQEVFDCQGHGCARLAEAPSRLSGPVVLTGPQRGLAAGLGWQVAAPVGDVMLSGAFGLVAAARRFWAGQ